MNAVKEVRKYLLKKPGTPSSRVLARLVAAIAEETEPSLHDLYEIEREAFELARDLMRTGGWTVTTQRGSSSLMSC